MGENYRIGQGIDVHKFSDTIDKKRPLNQPEVKFQQQQLKGQIHLLQRMKNDTYL